MRSMVARCVAAVRVAPSLPTWRASGSLYPLVQFWSLRLVQGGDLHVAGSIGGSEWRRRVEVRAAQEDHIHRNVVGAISMIHPSSGSP